MSTNPLCSEHPARASHEDEYEDLRRLVNVLRDRVIALWQQSEELTAAGQNTCAVNLQIEDTYAQYLELSMTVLVLDETRAVKRRHE
jgi:hypothetical protein